MFFLLLNLLVNRKTFILGEFILYIMSEFTIIKDSREKLDYNFDKYDVNTETKKLDTGDYAIQGYEDFFAIERKTDEDFLSSITKDRFKDELGRADVFVKPMTIVVEAPWREFKFSTGSSYENKFSDIHPNSVKGAKNKLPNYYNIEFKFVEGRPEGEELTYNKLKEFYETINLIDFEI